MNQFGFLLFDAFEDLDFFGPWEMIAHWSANFNGPKVCTISEHGQDVTSVKQLTLKVDTRIDNCPPLDYLLVPGGLGTRTEVNNPALIDFIREQATQAQAILSVCTGAFLLHQAGLLMNKRACTHWQSMNRLRHLDHVHVVEQRYVHDGNIWTSAGVSAGIDMALAFIADQAGNKTAANIQRYAEYFPDGKRYT